MNFLASDSENRVGMYDQYTTTMRLINELASNYVGSQLEKY